MSGLNAVMIHELRHRLQTLETDLREVAQSGLLTEHDFEMRLARLARSELQAKKLLQVASAKTLVAEIPSQVDLPVMSDASKVEQKIISRFVRDTKAYTKELAAKVGRIKTWSLEAAHGVPGWLSSMFRLSWIKSQIRRADLDLDAVRRARTVIEDFISKSEISGQSPHPRKNQRDLLVAFQEFESATGRVTSLRARLQGELAKNNEMRQWLQHYADQRREKTDGQLPPEPERLNEAFGPVAEYLTQGAKLAKDRLVTARQLIGALEDKVAVQQTPVSIIDQGVSIGRDEIDTSTARQRRGKKPRSSSDGMSLSKGSSP
jgi:hypothetical protein